MKGHAGEGVCGGGCVLGVQLFDQKRAYPEFCDFYSLYSSISLLN